MSQRGKSWGTRYNCPHGTEREGEEEEREKLAVRLSAETQAQRFASGTEEVRFLLKPLFKGLKIAL